MNLFADDDLTQDAFLGGKITLLQPRSGYRAGVDPVLLAASVDAAPGQEVLDLGCGAGAIGACLAARVPDLRVTGLERHAGYADLARRNAAANGQDFTVLTGDVQALPDALKAMAFDHVVCNPPYYDRTRGSVAPKEDREAALGEDVALAEWVRCGVKRLKPKGYIHIILKADRLSDLLSATTHPMGSIEILPIAPRVSKPAELVIVRARKDGRAALRLHPPVVLHDGEAHLGDRDHYSAGISDVLRRGAALKF